MHGTPFGQDGSQPNIVLVSADSLRGDHCGYLGDGNGLTPTLDTMARNGVSFHNAIAPGPQTFSSMPAVFTGYPREPSTLSEYPGESHWQRRLAAISDHMDRFPTFPERLQQLGYTTAAISPNPWTSRQTRFHAGFDEFVDVSGESDESAAGQRLQSIFARLPGLNGDDRAVELARDLFTNSSFFSKWPDIYSDIRTLREQLSEPYFLWVFLLDTHYPFLVERAHRSESSLHGMYYSNYKAGNLMRGNSASGELSERVQRALIASYRDSVRAVDGFLAQLRDDLGDDDPVFVVTSDHGESFGEHGNFGHHHRQLYEENIHVPYVIANCGASDAVRDPISLRTIPRTMRSLAAGRPFDPDAYTASHVLSQSECGTNWAIRGQRYKYMEFDGEGKVFDLQDDPEETDDVASAHPDLVAKCERTLAECKATYAETVELEEVAATVATDGGV